MRKQWILLPFSLFINVVAIAIPLKNAEAADPTDPLSCLPYARLWE